MDLLSLEVSVVSAEGLKNLDDLSSKMKVYVVVSVMSGVFSEQRAQTNVDMEGGENPKWNFPMKFLIDRNAAKQDLNSLLTFTLKSESSKVHKCIGEIKVRFAELMDFVGDRSSMQYVSRPIMDTSGQTTNGRFNFIFKFGALEVQAPVTHEEISHLDKVENENVGEKKKKNIATQVAKDVAMNSTIGSVTGVVSGATHVVAAYMTKKYVEGSISDEAATSNAETANLSDTSVADQSIDGSSSFLEIISSIFF